MSDNRNMFLAIGLSMMVLIGWQYFFAGPNVAQQQASSIPESASPATPGAATTADPAAPAAPAAVAVTTREDAVAATARVPIDTPSLVGSINLTGARIDDVSLRGYHVTVDDQSPIVTLLSPMGAPDAYFAEFGYSVPAGSDVVVPNATTVWTAPAGATLTPATPVTLTFDNGAGLVFERTISIDDDYMFRIDDAVRNEGTTAATVHPYGLVQRYGTPAAAGTYILHEGLIGVVGDGSLEEVDYADVKEEDAVLGAPTTDGWLGITDKYWAAAMIPKGEGAFTPRFAWFGTGGTDIYQADYLGEAMNVPAGGTASTETLLFAGAKETRVIDAYAAEYEIRSFDLMIDWGWFYFLTRPMFWLIDTLFQFTGNFGIAILLVTVIVKLIFFPLANKSYVSMSKMKKVQPQMTELRERYKDDRAKQQQALMELYKTEKINPLAGCLPIVVQIPVFFALYKSLYVTIEMRHAPFFGWIQDLSAPDPTSLFNLFGLLPFDVPAFLLIGVWPLIMGVTMFVQMQLNPQPTDETQKMIFTWMPLIFTFMLASFPAGLVIYWAWNNALSVLQQATIMKRQGVRIELFDNIRSMFQKKPKAETGS
jgi:YidC/Oxa1 family membrane protein insertase